MTSKKTAKEVLITYRHNWGKWPVSQDTDFEAILAERVRSPYIYPEQDAALDVETSVYPQYLPYVRANDLNLPAGMLPGEVNNLKKPSSDVMDQLTEDLIALSKTHEILRWQHAYQCYPEVMSRVVREGSFRLKILEFGDDCPGSSEFKTFPVAQFFDVLVYRMGVWDYATGVRTADKYQDLGLSRCILHIGGTSDHLLTWCQENEYSIRTRAEPDIDLIFIGYRGDMNPPRRRFLEELCRRVPETHQPFLLRGWGMPDGDLLPRSDVNRNGYVIAPYYARSRFGVNYPISSIYNGRLFDLFEMGVVQIVHDKHHELADFGYEDGIHYLEFDGTVDGLFAVMDHYRRNPMVLSQIAEDAKNHTDAITQAHSYREAIRHAYESLLQ